MTEEERVRYWLDSQDWKCGAIPCRDPNDPLLASKDTTIHPGEDLAVWNGRLCHLACAPSPEHYIAPKND